MKILGVIPSRFASSRFPGKALVDIGGKTMIQRVYEQATKCNSYSRVIVATDDQRIFDHVSGFGGNLTLTSSDHQNGTERCNEVYQNNKDHDYIVNIQGDEPFVHPDSLEKLNSILNGDIELGTLVKKIDDNSELGNPNVVKVVFNLNNEALYFSRSAVPFQREDVSYTIDYYKHIGIYSYRADILEKISSLPPSSLETIESLEQLRWIENGYKIKITTTSHHNIGIDTPEDLKSALTHLS